MSATFLPAVAIATARFDEVSVFPVPPFGLAAGLTAAAAVYNAALMVPIALALRGMRSLRLEAA